MDHLFNTFLHGVARHTGNKFATMFFIPLAIGFVGYGCYRFWKSKQIRN